MVNSQIFISQYPMSPYLDVWIIKEEEIRMREIKNYIE